MDSQVYPTTPLPTNNLLSKLALLSEAGHFYLEEKNKDQLYKDWTYTNTEIYLREVVLTLGLMEYFKGESVSFESLLSALDQFLSSPDKNQLESVVPFGILKNLEEILDEENRKKEEIAESIKKAQDEKLAYIKKLAGIKKRLEQKAEEVLIPQEEIVKIAQQIIEEIQPEINNLAKQSQKAIEDENEDLEKVLQEKGQQIYLQAIGKIEFPPVFLQYLLAQELSANTIIKLANQTDNLQRQVTLAAAISPLTKEESLLVREKILPAVYVNITNLSSQTTTEEIKEVVTLSFLQEISEFSQEQLPSEKILYLIKVLSSESQEIVANNQEIFSPAAAPTLIQDNGRVYISLTSPPIPGNPQGEVYKLPGKKDNLTKDFLESLKNGTFKEKAGQLESRISDLTLFKLSIQGISTEELEQMALLAKYKGSFSEVTQLQETASRLRSFQQQAFYRRSDQLQIWETNKDNCFSFSQQVQGFLSGSGISQTVNLGVSKFARQTAQNSLQNLWSGLKIGANRITSGGIGKVFSTGLKTLSTAMLPGLSKAAAFLGLNIFKGAKNILKIGAGIGSGGLSFVGSLLSFSSGGSGKKILELFTWVLVVAIAIVFVLAGPITFSVIGGAFVSQAGSITKSTSECFSFEGSWDQGDLGMENSAILSLSNSLSYFSKLCNKDQLIILVRENSDQWCYVQGNSIYITDKCLGNEENAFYSLTHETGHIFAARNGTIYSEFEKIFGAANKPEAAVCTYPIKPITTSEDFAESITLYLTNQNYPERIYNGCGSKKVILQTEYPIHYTFVTQYIF